MMALTSFIGLTSIFIYEPYLQLPYVSDLVPYVPLSYILTPTSRNIILRDFYSHFMQYYCSIFQLT